MKQKTNQPITNQPTDMSCFREVTILHPSTKALREAGGELSVSDDRKLDVKKHNFLEHSSIIFSLFGLFDEKAYNFDI